MTNAYKNNNDTPMTWDIFQHQEQRMMRSNTEEADGPCESRAQDQAELHAEVRTASSC